MVIPIIHAPTINRIVTINNASFPIWLICMQVLCRLSIWWIMLVVMLPYNPYSHTSSSNRTVLQLPLKRLFQMVTQLYLRQDIHTHMVNHKQSNSKQSSKTLIFNDCDFLWNFLDLGANFFFFQCLVTNWSHIPNLINKVNFIANYLL